MSRKEIATHVQLPGGAAATVRVMDGLLIDDLVQLAMKAEGYRVITGRDVFPEVDRKLKDYLIRTGVFLE